MQGLASSLEPMQWQSDLIAQGLPGHTSVFGPSRGAMKNPGMAGLLPLSFLVGRIAMQLSNQIGDWIGRAHIWLCGVASLEVMRHLNLWEAMSPSATGGGFDGCFGSRRNRSGTRAGGCDRRRIRRDQRC